MAQVTIYHNPRCSKSRQTVALLEEKGIEPVVVEYLKTPPDRETLEDLLDMLGLRPKDILRRKEQAYADLELADKLDDDDALLDAMVDNPILIERPIVVSDGRARLGRPPENVLEIV